MRIAELCGRNRFSVMRWLDGTAEPRLPDFLRLIEATSRRLLDLLEALEDPRRLPSVSRRWRQLARAREAAYERPFSHAVLRALELRGAERPMPGQARWLARRLGAPAAEVEQALALLSASEQVRATSRGYRLLDVPAVDTSHEPTRARALKAAWIETALERLRAGAPGNYGYSVFSVSHEDMQRLQRLQLEYVRAMQELIASSQPSECVGLYCAQLLDLGARPDG